MLATARLLQAYKQVLNSGLVSEIKIWEVPKSKAYPEGIKYRLVIADPLWKKILVLFDNHSPKGHHWHDADKNEHEYNFISLSALIRDFQIWQSYLEKEYENNENSNKK